MARKKVEFVFTSGGNVFFKGAVLEFPGYDRKMVVTGASKDGRYLLVKEPGLLGMRGEIRADKPINFNKPLKNVRVGLPWGPKETIYGTNPRKKRKVRKR